jgi:polysaccharide export outer membrane protein
MDKFQKVGMPAMRSFVSLFKALFFRTGIAAVIVLMLLTVQRAAAGEAEYVLGQGDVIRITVYQNPDMTTEVRISESGMITFPLIGSVKVGALSISEAERLIASRLQQGNYVQQPQVNILPTQVRGSQAAVLGYVNRPGRYPLEMANVHVSDLLAAAGGLAAGGADSILLTTKRDGRLIRRKIDISALFIDGTTLDERIQPGDIIYVDKAPTFYIYGQVQRPGVYRLERNMSVMQGLAAGGGLTPRGTENGVRIHRRGADGKTRNIEPKLDDVMEANDVIYVRESLF